MEYGMEDFRYGMEMEWKKIASMEYGKIVFHYTPCPDYWKPLAKNKTIYYHDPMSYVKLEN